MSEKTGSDVAAQAVVNGTDGESIPKDVFDTMLADSGLMGADGTLQAKDDYSGADDSIPEDADSGSDEDDEDDLGGGASVPDDDEEEGEAEPADEEEASAEEDEDDEELADARDALLEAGILTKKQLKGLAPDALLALAHRLPLQGDAGESETRAADQGKQAAQAPEAFDFDAQFAEHVAPGMQEYLGDDGAKGLEKFLKSFQAHQETAIQRAIETTKAQENGRRAIEQGMASLREQFPQLEGNDRLSNKILKNVQVLVAGGQRARSPEQLFKTAARMEGLTPGGKKPKVSTSDVLNGQPRIPKTPPNRRTPKSADAWDKQYMHLRVDKGMSDAKAKHQLGKRPPAARLV